MEISAILMGQRVRAARKMKQMNTDELAEKVGVAVESIGHIECGARKPSLTLLFNIAEVLEVSLDYLTGRTENSSDAVFHECADHNGLTPDQEQMLLELCRSMIPIIKKRSYRWREASEDPHWKVLGIHAINMNYMPGDFIETDY